VREETKYEHMMEFAQGAAGHRAAISRDMALRGLPREKVLATVVHLLETTLIRVGNDDYAKENKSYGLTTLRNPHVASRARSCASSSRARAARPGACS
jgi:DNA topoisomerase-1